MLVDATNNPTTTHVVVNHHQQRHHHHHHHHHHHGLAEAEAGHPVNDVEPSENSLGSPSKNGFQSIESEGLKLSLTTPTTDAGVVVNHRSNNSQCSSPISTKSGASLPSNYSIKSNQDPPYPNVEGLDPAYFKDSNFLTKITKKFTKSQKEKSHSIGNIDTVEGSVVKNTSIPNKYTKFPFRSTQPSTTPPAPPFSERSSEISEPVHSAATSVTASINPSFTSPHGGDKDKVREVGVCSSVEVGSVPRSNSRFDPSQIQTTALTRVYLNPNRQSSCQDSAPPTGSKRSSSFSPSSFIASAVSSFSRKSRGPTSKSPSTKSSTFFGKLIRKSKSDNNISRLAVRIPSPSPRFLGLETSLSSGGGSTSSGVGGSHSSRPARRSPIVTSSQNIYNAEPSRSEACRLNSVQSGDHAAVHLPWTGFLQSGSGGSSSSSSGQGAVIRDSTRSSPSCNLSSQIDNAHSSRSCSRDQLEHEFETVQYIANICARDSRHQTQLGCNNNITSKCEFSSNTKGTSRESQGAVPGKSKTQKKRSKSLERDHNLRIVPNFSLKGNWNFSRTPAFNLLNPRGSRPTDSCNSNTERDSTAPNNVLAKNLETQSLERNRTVVISRNLTVAEQEKVLRNITWKRSLNDLSPSAITAEACQSLANRNENKYKPNNNDPTTKSRIGVCAPLQLNPLDHQSPAINFTNNSKKAQRQLHIGAITVAQTQRSTLSSGSQSTRSSSDSFNSLIKPSSSDSPPSPPPRPLWTLKSESSRLIVKPPLLPKKPLASSNSNAGHYHYPSNNINYPGGKDSDSCKSSTRTSSTTSSSSCTSNATAKSNNRGSNPPESFDSGISYSSSGRSSTSRGVSRGFEEDSGASRIVVNIWGSSMSLEDAMNTSFINKPSNGWLHSDLQLTTEGVIYPVRYIGCIDVNISMKSLDFDTRSLIAKYYALLALSKECINQVCEAAGLKPFERSKKLDPRLIKVLGRPRLENADTDVDLTISSTCLKLTSLESGAQIAVHDMPNISFASGGDTSMLEFVAYVAKDAVVGRACVVLRCGSGSSQDVMTTIGQAFELRFKEYINKRTPAPLLVYEDPEYYNDLPGKAPPELAGGNRNSKSKGLPEKSKEHPALTLPSSDRELTINLIDFEAPTPPAFGPSTQDRHMEAFLNHADTSSVVSGTASTFNPNVGTGLGLPNSPSQPQPLAKDPFDMQPFASTIPKVLSIAEERKLLQQEDWFHESISRSDAEAMMQKDGDFLVRESLTNPGQYVLTGLEKDCPKHLLLKDAQGQVRTKFQTFENITHLIRHHKDNSLPIMSAESMILLRHPISRSQVISP